MLREGTLDDLPRAAVLRQRAWPESIVTEEGTWMLPYEGVAGLKISERSSATAPKTGFLR